MKRSRLILFSVLSMLIIMSCNRRDNFTNYTDPNLPAPAQVTNPRVTPLPGGAYILYTLPKDTNLRYVKAVYETTPGQAWEVKSSVYSDTLKIEGFGDTNPRDIKVYSVGRNEKMSEPVIVTIKPLPPSILDVYKTLTIAPTFGGINVKFKNPTRSSLAIVIMMDSLGNGDYRDLHTFYSSNADGNFSLRGMDTTNKKIAVYIRDRWNYKTDTTLSTVKPLFEKLLSKSDWKPMYFKGDDFGYVEWFELWHLWDNGPINNYCCIFATNKFNLPHTITIDLGKKVVLSRMKTWHHPESPYAGASVKSFEIWGANTVGPLNGNEYVDWDTETSIYTSNWQFLQAFKSFKPSGAPYGTVTAEDFAYSNGTGEDFEFEPGLPAIRYLRFRTTETYAQSSGLAQVVIQELTLWGQEVK